MMMSKSTHKVKYESVGKKDNHFYENHLENIYERIQNRAQINDKSKNGEEYDNSVSDKKGSSHDDDDEEFDTYHPAKINQYATIRGSSDFVRHKPSPSEEFLEIEDKGIKIGSLVKQKADHFYVKPKINVYNQAQKILQSHKEKIARYDFQKNFLSNAVKYPNLSAQIKAIKPCAEFPLVKTDNKNTVTTHDTNSIADQQKYMSNNDISPCGTGRSKLKIFNPMDTICEMSDMKQNMNNSKSTIDHKLNAMTILEFLLSPMKRGFRINNADMKGFLIKPVDSEVWLRGKIERKKEKKGACYYFYLNDNERFLMAAIKPAWKKYHFTLSEDPKYQKDENYTGKLKPNFLGTEFEIYDNGKKPKKGRNEDLRNNLGAITYEPNLFGLKGPRKMKVYIPNILEDSQPMTIIPKNPGDTIVKRYLSSNLKISTVNKRKDILVYINKPPVLSRKYKCYVLDYKDRSIRSSVKNFQLIQENKEEILYQFGRTGDNSFIVDFKFPFSPIQAFAIALSSIASKLACE